MNQSALMTITLDGKSLTIEEVAHCAAYPGTTLVTVSDAVWERLTAARAVIDSLAQGEQFIYGLNTGLGALKDERVQPAQISQYQRNIVMSHASAVGQPYPPSVVRAIMLAHLNLLAQGGSGIQPAVFKLILDMLNAGVYPVVPMTGSVGMADLAQMAHLALPLIGLGEVEYQGQTLPALAGLAAAGLEPVELAAKDGLALVSFNAANAGHAAVVFEAYQDIAKVLDISAALAYEGYKAHVDVLDPLFEPRLTQAEAVIFHRLRALLTGSHLFDLEHKTVQDPISYRSVVRVHAALLKTLVFVRDAVETELNTPAENPTVFIDEGVMLPTGNYHPSALATALDLLLISVTQAVTMCANRVLRLNTPHLSHLPGQLTMEPGLNLGFGVVQKTITALAAEIRHLANPASLDFFPVADGIEDHATNATYVVQKAEQAAHKLRYVLALELLTAAQAIDLRGDADHLGALTSRVHAKIREQVPFLEQDTVIAPHIEAIYKLVLVRAFSSVLPD